MEEYCLTAEELLYLAAMAGADTVFGVQDRLSGLSDQQLKLTIVETERRLSEKGYLNEEFDGNKQVLPQLMELIEGLGTGERLLCLEKERIGESQYGCIYFLKETDICKMERGKEIYILSGSSPSSLRKEVAQAVSIEETETAVQETFSISREQLNLVRTLIRRGAGERAAELLKEAGAPEKMARVILGGMEKKADFYGLLFMDRRAEKNAVGSVQWLKGKQLLLMEYEMRDDEDYVKFSVTGSGELKRKLESGFDIIDCPKEEAFS